MSSNSKDSGVDRFVSALPAWQKEIFTRVRQLIHEADADIQEIIKRTDWPFFVLKGNVCAFQTTKDHANVYIYDPLAPDPENIVTQGQGNTTGRLIQIYENQSFNEDAFKKLIKAVTDNNRAGGWRKLKNS